MNYLEKFQAENNLKVDNSLGRITFNKMSEVFQMNKEHLAYWLAQIEHETGKFRYGVENLNYSSKQLKKVFKKYFYHRNGQPIKSNNPNYRWLVNEYEYRPKMIANRVYGGRMGNTKPNDGWYNRGRFCIQLTGHNNYLEFQDWIDRTAECPDYILDDLDMFVDKYYWIAGMFFFDKNRIFKRAEKVKPKKGQTLIEAKAIKISEIVNGGHNGLNRRIKLTKKYLNYV